MGKPDSDAFLDRIRGAEDLAPTVGGGRYGGAVPVTIGGTVYAGIGAVPIEALALCSAADYGAMRPHSAPTGRAAC
jgi:hypothetical protein